MNTTPPVLKPTKRRRHIWRWVFGIFAVGVLGVAGAAYSVLTLSREAATLRGEMMTAVDAPFHTRVQLSLGSVSLGLVRTGLRLAPLPPEARLGLQAARKVSVGVYELKADSQGPTKSRAEWLATTDRAMTRRGYVRVVGVREQAQTVLVYAPEHGDEDELDVCVAVFDGEQLVIASARVASEPLMELIAQQQLPRAIARER